MRRSAVFTFSRRDEDGGYDHISTSIQVKLNAGDTFTMSFDGHFCGPNHYHNTYFEGHLIRQIK